ncbi:MAG TPA: hypothetical protein DCX89_07455 [Saprospirales bacterium]|nr:hypothetical protein [Saprospirales bacterium]HAY71713.1 hypothetical protein [Saprospirales bacterium]HRQ29448.1 DUF1801 domain-containing protein [Saprospiraceae bacterium]
MEIKALTPDQYIEQLPEERIEVFSRLRQLLKEKLPKGFEETMSYGMIGFVVPHSIFPSGYHCDPKLPLPFISLASQKNAISLYHSGIYADPELLNWFVQEYPKHCKTKLDMGKSCIRFKKMNDIPFDLIAELAQKLTPEEWIARYQAALKK